MKGQDRFQETIDRGPIEETPSTSWHCQWDSVCGKGRNLTLLLECSTDWVTWHDSNGVLRYASPARLDLTGYTDKEMEGQAELYLSIVHDKDHAKVKADETYTSKDTKPEPLEFRLKTRAGRTIWVSRVSRGIQDGLGNPLGRWSSHRNVTREVRRRRRYRRMVRELREAMTEIKTLKSLIPICCGCRKVREPTGNWEQLEHYLQQEFDAHFTHGICPHCRDELYGYLDLPLRQNG